MPDRHHVAVMMSRIIEALADQTDKDKLWVLAHTWLAVAANARTDVLTTPSAFTEERADQLRMLTRMIASIEAAEPDLERLFEVEMPSKES